MKLVTIDIAYAHGQYLAVTTRTYSQGNFCTSYTSEMVSDHGVPITRHIVESIKSKVPTRETSRIFASDGWYDALSAEWEERSPMGDFKENPKKEA